jgi:acyl-[acyl-carrier-protein]-phospholipid O-acyltransferase/long-chain-fatty-acid--[acyl-carrier-protein] ligase
MSEPVPPIDGDLPESLWRDKSFWGMTATQFLGAFNDNLYKQAALLVCTDLALAQNSSIDLQDLAMALFALPFILFSGFAGYLSDRTSKRRIVVLCKFAEIGIVALGAVALLHNHFHLVLAVVFLMGTHSAFFGPAKYGILPEIVREKNLPQANGIFLMTTFLAIIIGVGAAGYVKKPIWDEGQWRYSAAFLGVAIFGVMTSLLVRKTPVAHPGLAFQISSLAVSRDTINVFRRDPPLLMALLMYSLFWLLAGIVHPSINAFGKFQLRLGDQQTSLMPAFLSLGIAAGCALAGILSHEKVNFRLVTWGAWGISLALALVAIVGRLALPTMIVYYLVSIFLFAAGAAVGLFSVPLQVFLQGRPPRDQKGRVIGAMNLLNWVGIFLAAGMYGALTRLIAWLGVGQWALFASTAAMMLPVALFYHPRETPRPDEVTSC